MKYPYFRPVGIDFRKAFPAGVRHMLLATFWFALMNVCVKMLVHLPTMELVFFRCGIATLICFISLYRAGLDWTGSNRLLLLLRGGFGTLALYLFFYTVQHMPLGTAVTIQYLSPVFTSVFAVFLLREPLRPLQVFSFAVSFGGVLLMKGFDGSVSWTLLTIGVVSAVFSALAYNMVRTLREREHPLVVVLHFQLLGALTGAAFSVFDWRMPAGSDWIFLLLLGIFTQLGQENLTRSLQMENMARVSILNYLGVVYALLFGWMFFDESHGMQEYAGMAMVLAGVVMNFFTTVRKV